MKRDMVLSLSRFFPDSFARPIAALGFEIMDNVEEIRFRAGRPPYVYTAQGGGAVSGPAATGEDIAAILSAMTMHSPYCYVSEISRGYFTVNGARVGISGSFKMEKGEIKLEAAWGLNIRVPSQHIGVCSSLLPYITSRGALLSTLIYSRPCLGKTTLARDIARAAAQGEDVFPAKVSVIDERGELAGGGAFDLGAQADVISNIKKSVGMGIALRTLSPSVMVTDELGDPDDAAALTEAANSGVTVVATAHAGGIEGLRLRKTLCDITAAGLFARYVELCDVLGRITVANIYNERLEGMSGRCLKLEGAADA